MSNASAEGRLTKKIHLVPDNEKLNIDDIEIMASSNNIVLGSIEQKENGYSFDVSLNPVCPPGTWTEIVKLSYKETDKKKEVKVPVYVMKR